MSEAAAVDWKTAAAMKTAQLNSTRTATPAGMSNPRGAEEEDVLGDTFPLLLATEAGDRG